MNEYNFWIVLEIDITHRTNDCIIQGPPVYLNVASLDCSLLKISGERGLKKNLLGATGVVNVHDANSVHVYCLISSSMALSYTNIAQFSETKHNSRPIKCALHHAILSKMSDLAKLDFKCQVVNTNYIFILIHVRTSECPGKYQSIHDM